MLKKYHPFTHITIECLNTQSIELGATVELSHKRIKNDW